MSKLPKAPLIEVIFELRWVINDPQELQNMQYLQGDLYPLLKDRYPHREALTSLPPNIFVNAPSNRFWTAPYIYPLVQIGPGLITLNTTDSTYFWDKFEPEILHILKMTNTIYEFKESHNAHVSLQYIDFLKFDFTKNNIFDYLEKKLNISIKQDFYKSQSNSSNLNLGFQYENDLGTLAISISRGKNQQNEDGIAILTNVLSKSILPEINLVKNWLKEAHALTRSLFKEMTKGELQTYFASK